MGLFQRLRFIQGGKSPYCFLLFLFGREAFISLRELITTFDNYLLARIYGNLKLTPNIRLGLLIQKKKDVMNLAKDDSDPLVIF